MRMSVCEKRKGTLKRRSGEVGGFSYNLSSWRPAYWGKMSVCEKRKGWRMTGSAGGVYGARRTVSLKNTKIRGEDLEGGDKQIGAGRKWVDFEKR